MLPNIAPEITIKTVGKPELEKLLPKTSYDIVVPSPSVDQINDFEY